ncbi:hypothetical protein O1611_g7495 [Lasiodiplodia mahajangana]|uniref:Uncharacterized protein n=1 Tax=Lasiodiplodia mahajangana TaxID=1108764 RepID=A0ACC2JFK6_9PEZI|nr:hypothetical protein O1611_g7495 [Lasiodiplodia mahajangana]
MPKSPNRRARAPSRQPVSVSPQPSDGSGSVATSSSHTEPASTANAVIVAEKSGSDLGYASSDRSQSQLAEGRDPKNFIHPDFIDIGMALKKYNDALSDIQGLGISRVVLPELVLVGDQSAGKSSLMSALSRLNLPTSSGICTRCPFHIRMSSSKDSHVSCTVSLQQAYEYRPPTNRSIRQSDVTKKNPFPPWIPKLVTETIVFKTIYDNDPIAIDEILRWAQIATLNPSQNPQQFVPGEGGYAKETSLETAKRSTEARFSPNVVSLEMKGPCFPDLSFFDLPGIFAVAEDKGDDYLVDVVENLTRKYVGSKGAIIMLALPMDHDIDNSRTLKIIRELNAESRTIGILTKADRPTFNMPDTIAYWLAVLDEKRQRVKENGFYITSLPPDEPFDSLWEESFFRTGAANWPRAFDKYHHRCGVDQLRPHIAKELGGALPNIKEEFKNCLQDIQGRLNELPNLPRNVEHEVRMSLREFYNSVKHAVDSQEFEQDSKGLTDAFYRHLMELKPKCVTVTEKAKPKQEEIVIVSDESENEVTGSKRVALGRAVISSTPKRRRRDDTGLFVTPVKAEASPNSAAFQSPVTPVPCMLRRSNDNGVKLSLLEIQKDIKLKTRGGFSDVVPLQVHEKLCLSAVSQWEKPLEVYIDKSTAMLMTAVTEALESSLKHFSNRLIYKESYELLMAFLRERGTHQREKLLDLYKNETYRVVTINERGLDYFEAKEKEVLENHRILQRAREAGLVTEPGKFKPDGFMSPEEKAVQSSLLSNWKAQLPEDDFKREMDVAAKVRGYYLVAATRFVDGVSMDINSRLFRSFREGALDDYLETKLGLFPYPSLETYTRLMEEDIMTAQKREQLRKEQTKLNSALQIILTLECSLTKYTRQQNSQQSTMDIDGAFNHNGKMEM